MTRIIIAIHELRKENVHVVDDTCTSDEDAMEAVAGVLPLAMSWVSAWVTEEGSLNMPVIRSSF